LTECTNGNICELHTHCSHCGELREVEYDELFQDQLKCKKCKKEFYV